MAGVTAQDLARNAARNQSLGYMLLGVLAAVVIGVFIMEFMPDEPEQQSPTPDEELFL